MSRKLITRYVTPWVSKRDKEEQKRVAELRQRDGDSCRRCRRPIRFDLPPGSDRGPRVETIAASEITVLLDSLVLCHGRCNADSGDNTPEVTERVRRRSEAALFAKSRKRARA